MRPANAKPRTLFLLLLACALAACGGSEIADGADADTDTDADTDADADGDTDTDVDPDSPLPDTGQTSCYSTSAAITCPASTGSQYYGQDAYYVGNVPSYTSNGDGTISDNVTGLMWIREPETATFDEAAALCSDLTTGGHTDWRVPSVTEMYTLIDFDGATGTAQPDATEAPADAVPYIDTDHFGFYYGTEIPGVGNRYIDSQYITTSVYVSTVMDGQTCVFGTNLADGRIKCYPTNPHHGNDDFLHCVRGAYTVNTFVDNGDGTITDADTDLTWMQQDSGHLGAGELGDGAVDWLEALTFCEDLVLAGHADWRLPDAKELQSLVDYSRSPDTTSSAAIDPLFDCTGITNEAGQADFPWYWTGTTHLDGPVDGANAVYVCFGRGTGQMNQVKMDVHGAGAQRSDPKVAASREATCGNGPQGDCRRTYNFARCVRGGPATPGGGDADADTDADTDVDVDADTDADADADTDTEPGPTSCAEQADCEAPGACPREAALGCTCRPAMGGALACIPDCNDDADCPPGPGGMTITCGAEGFCVPG